MNLVPLCMSFLFLRYSLLRYYTTLPTDSLAVFRDVLAETTAYGFEKIQQDMWTLGNAVRAELEARGFKSVAAEGFKSPGISNYYTQVHSFRCCCFLL